MKPREVSVSVVQFPNDELFVNVTFKVRGHELGVEACSPDGDCAKAGKRVSASSRKRKQKELQKIIEAVDFGGYQIQENTNESQADQSKDQDDQ